jgi:hypothetical protein
VKLSRNMKVNLAIALIGAAAAIGAAATAGAFDNLSNNSNITQTGSGNYACINDGHCTQGGK